MKIPRVFSSQPITKGNSRKLTAIIKEDKNKKDQEIINMHLDIIANKVNLHKKINITY